MSISQELNEHFDYLKASTERGIADINSELVGAVDASDVINVLRRMRIAVEELTDQLQYFKPDNLTLEQYLSLYQFCSRQGVKFEDCDFRSVYPSDEEHGFVEGTAGKIHCGCNKHGRVNT